MKSSNAGARYSPDAASGTLTSPRDVYVGSAVSSSAAIYSAKDLQAKFGSSITSAKKNPSAEIINNFSVSAKILKYGAKALNTVRSDKMATTAKGISWSGLHNAENSVSNTLHATKGAYSAVGAGLTVLGVGLDIAGKKLDDGKFTTKDAAGVAGKTAGSLAGAKGGALLGAAVGTMICPGIGTLIGGFIGGIGGALAGGYGGEKAGEFVHDSLMKDTTLF
jgi:hypothetical protein